MSNTEVKPYDIVVCFHDGQTMIFRNVNGFRHIINDNVWKITTNNEDCSYVDDRSVRFIGHKYVWDKMKSDNTIKVEEEQPVPSYIPGARTCRNCYHQGLCDSYYRFKDSSYAEICADYKKDF